MTYATPQDLIDRFGEQEILDLADRDRDGVIDPGVVEDAISDAAGEIDGYLAGRYAVPLTIVPRVIQRIAIDMARYNLYDNQPTPIVEQRYQNAIDFLKGISRGQVSIGVTEDGAKPASHNTAQMHSGGNVFNRDDKSFI